VKKVSQKKYRQSISSPMFRALRLPTTTTRSLVNVQRRFQSVQIVSDQPRLTTDLFLKGLERFAASETPYKSKYPDMSFQDYEAKLNELLAKPVYYDEAMIDLVHKVLGFPKEEVEYGFTGKLPDLATKEKDGSYNINWKTVAEVYGRTDREATKIDELEKLFKVIETTEAEVTEGAREQVDIDWEDWKHRIGHEAASEAKTHLEQAFQQTKPEVDFKAVQQVYQRNLTPVLEFVKDELIDQLPLLSDFTNDLVRDSQLLRTDEYGNPLVNFDSPAFMDEYYPKERDEMILEIEDDIWDTNYVADKKKLRMSPDELSEYNKDWVLTESLKLEDAGAIQVEGGGGVSAQRREEELIFKDVMEYGRRNKILEAEVSTLRLQKEFESDESAKSPGEGGERKDDVVSTDESGFAEGDFINLITAMGGGSIESARDFKVRHNIFSVHT
jgi:hypothetical protein